MSARLAAVAASTPAHLAAAAAAGGLAAVLLARLRFAAAPQCEECAPPDADDVDSWLALAHRERLATRYVTLCYVLLRCDVPLHCIASRDVGCTVLRGVAWRGVVSRCVAWCGVAWCGVALHHVTWRCAMLRYVT